MRQAETMLAHAGIEDAKASVRLLTSAACRMSAASLITNEEAEIGDKAAQQLTGYIARRLRHEPVSRILGSRSFWKGEFQISSDVLDPRSDTETLIETVLQHFASRRSDPLNILDIGTGSGIILCSLLQEFSAATGLGIDISAGACVVARKNVVGLGLAGRAAIANIGWSDLPSAPAWDLIVSNPPYIPTVSLDCLEPEVRQWDPSLALDGGPDGLDAYRALGPVIRDRLNGEGLGVLEIGHDQGETVPSIMGQCGLQHIETVLDLGGRARVVVVKK
jgi:release factor glutamine methyltransferase